VTDSNSVQPEEINITVTPSYTYTVTNSSGVVSIHIHPEKNTVALITEVKTIFS